MDIFCQASLSHLCRRSNSHLAFNVSMQLWWLGLQHKDYPLCTKICIVGSLWLSLEWAIHHPRRCSFFKNLVAQFDIPIFPFFLFGKLVFWLIISYILNNLSIICTIFKVLELFCRSFILLNHLNIRLTWNSLSMADLDLIKFAATERRLLHYLLKHVDLTISLANSAVRGGTGPNSLSKNF